MKRIYTDVSNFRAPYDDVHFAGLGASHQWPAGRQVFDISNYRTPYDEGYFQDNSLFGFGYDPGGGAVAPPLPDAAPPTTPGWVYWVGGLAAVALMGGIAYAVARGTPDMDDGTEGRGVRI